MRLETFTDFTDHFIDSIIFPGRPICLEALTHFFPEPVHFQTGKHLFHDLQLLGGEIIDHAMQNREFLFTCDC